MLRYAIPPPQTAKIQVIWLNWSFTEKDLAFMNQGARWLFDWRTNSEAAEYGMSTDDALNRGGYLGYGRRPRSTSLGANLGEIHLGDKEKSWCGASTYEGNVDRSFARSAGVCFQRQSGSISLAS